MTDLQKVILVALGTLILLALIVGAVLRHHIGGFIETVAREAREEEERLEREYEAQMRAKRAADAGERPAGEADDPKGHGDSKENEEAGV